MIHEHEMERDVKTMSKSMLIVMVFTMVSKITGYLREILLASQYVCLLYRGAKHLVFTCYLFYRYFSSRKLIDVIT